MFTYKAKDNKGDVITGSLDSLAERRYADRLDLAVVLSCSGSLDAPFKHGLDIPGRHSSAEGSGGCLGVFGHSSPAPTAGCARPPGR